ncbi:MULTISPECIES: phage tail assembly protein [Burkholderia]|jgi:phage FluMu protein gp41|uniref:Mu-like prophage FluMu protein gp41 n=3 Tax=Burkholderia cepacia complex TaxID=87882 RepID=A0A6J5ITA6_9BURK|nr:MULTISPECIES: phage tail assembly protein [Burkholderia]YP_002221455.1 tail assembly protein [Burkholderia phage KS10]KIS46556.1 mu-like prophage FluMu gp41 family protein [Burkholderia cepacia]ACH72958.1 gp39 [Burkholderia phage KS10]AYQ40289.1 hypothetical protein CVS37_19390 [Burkholderia lata]EPZ86583.1 Mu-like prophage FluMu protein gp41 [Burkholderia cenocepacia K56-2Valvano]ERI25588.1 Mu-like prophage FluMu protein gp41 [Burkholderia cenocepacia BC7]
MNKQDIHVITLVDGLRSQVGDKEVRYRTVRLRETTVADEYVAMQLAERVVDVKGKPTLLVSDDLYRIALTMRHCERFQCAGLDDIQLELLTLEMFGRLSPLDLARIEERCVLVDLAAQYRHGLITKDAFDSMLADSTNSESAGPRSEGQAAELGDAGAATQSGPSMLADFAARDAQGAADGASR